MLEKTDTTQVVCPCRNSFLALLRKFILFWMSNPKINWENRRKYSNSSVRIKAEQLIWRYYFSLESTDTWNQKSKLVFLGTGRKIHGQERSKSILLVLLEVVDHVVRMCITFSCLHQNKYYKYLYLFNIH